MLFNAKTFLDESGLEKVLHTISENLNEHREEIDRLISDNELDGSSIFLTKKSVADAGVFLPISEYLEVTDNRVVKEGDFIIDQYSTTMYYIPDADDTKFVARRMFDLKATDGKDGVSIENFTITKDGELLIYLDDGSVKNAGVVTGEKGATGLSAFELAQSIGYDGTLENWLKTLKGDSISDVRIDEAGNLVLTLKVIDNEGTVTETTKTVGRVLGAKGTGITDAYIDAQGFIHLRLTSYDLENKETHDDFVISTNVIGRDGLTPELQVNTNKESSNYGKWEVSYDEGRNWIPLNYHAIALPAKFSFGEEGTSEQYVLTVEQFNPNTHESLGTVSRNLKGRSAYEVAKDNGFVGTYEEWHESLRGPQGIQGEKGDKGNDLTFDWVSASGEKYTLLERLMRADLNGDGKVDSQDVMIIDRYVKDSVSFPLTAEQLNLADIDGDGEVTSYDVAILKDYVEGGSLKGGFEGKIKNPNTFLQVEDGEHIEKVDLRGPQGPQGIVGPQGRSITNARIETSAATDAQGRGCLFLKFTTYNDDGTENGSTEENLGVVVGRGVESVRIDDIGDLFVKYTANDDNVDDDEIKVGNIKCVKEFTQSNDDENEVATVSIKYNNGDEDTVAIPYGVTPLLIVDRVPEYDEEGNDIGVLYDCLSVSYDDGVTWTPISDRLSGKSAYELAVDNGFEGSLREWFDSLVGPVGPQGEQGERGVSGVYVGIGEMPKGYNVQIDPSGEAAWGVMRDMGPAPHNSLHFVGENIGDVYSVTDSNDYRIARYVWNGKSWDLLGGEYKIVTDMRGDTQDRVVTDAAVKDFVNESISAPKDCVVLIDRADSSRKYSLFVEDGSLKLEEVIDNG